MSKDKYNPTVSVIVPIFNVERLLNRCINSIINQTYSNLEIILVDDGSPDSCGEICEIYKQKDSRIKVIHKKNEGLGYARNSGLNIASGEFVVFIDSDDYVKNDYIEKLLLPMIEHQLDLCMAGFIRIFASSKSIECPVSKEKILITEKHIISELLLPVIGADISYKSDVEREMCVWRNMYRRSLIEKINLRFVSEREYISEDIFFNMHYFINCKKAMLIPDCIYYYSENENSLSNTYRNDRFEKYCKMLNEQICILKNYDIYEISKQRLYRTFLMKTKKCIKMIAKSNLNRNEKIDTINKILDNITLKNVLSEYNLTLKMGLKKYIIIYLIKKQKSKYLLFFYSMFKSSL